MTFLSNEQMEALATLRRHRKKRELCIVGAAAVAVQATDILTRTTEDVYIAVLCAAGDDGLDSELSVDGWNRDKAVAHRWHTPGGAMLDILVFSSTDLEHGSMSTGGDREMGLVGFDLAMKHALDVDLGAEAGVWSVAPLPVIALLKAAAFLDRPTERKKDLTDLAFLLARYRAGDEYTVDAVEFESANAFLLGSDLKPICEDKHVQVLREFLVEVTDPDGGPHQFMIESGPNVLWKNPEILAGQFQAFSRGAGVSLLP